MTAHLTIADGGEALAIAVVEPTWTDFHVGYRVGCAAPAGPGRGRAGDPAGAVRGPDRVRASRPVSLQAGARGVAAPVLGVEGLEASVGIVTLGELDPDSVGPVVREAAGEVARRLA